ncbi:helix-turn-helix domain-containing protein [Devosia sp. 919]|uniref:helix-turn-helix transcriptional regulator n=1 Tax=Devosia sp. 919 TaxID=2726065 RepID=UPI001557109F|nr:helix-turn-helix domain-containing protein [Devosia sp. 919]
MRTFQEASALSEPTGDEPVDRFALSYMAGLARDRIHQMILTAFVESRLTKAQLARRLGMDRSRLSKILNTSSNITAETLGQVMFAIDGSCPRVERDWPLREGMQNLREPIWLADCLDNVKISSGSGVAFHKCAGRNVSTSRPMTMTVQKAAVVEVPEHA